LHWKAHYGSWEATQPRYEAWPFGALSLYGWHADAYKQELRLEMQADRIIATDESGRKLDLGIRYIFGSAKESVRRPGFMGLG